MYDFHWSYPLLIGFVICVFIQSYGQLYEINEAFQSFVQRCYFGHTRCTPPTINETYNLNS